MLETTVGVRELKSNLSRYLRQVKAGRTIVITEYGKIVGRIMPASLTLEERLRMMIDAGRASWSGRKFQPKKPAAKTRGSRTVADLLIEDRE
jgi:prevent-host-death family protein